MNRLLKVVIVVVTLSLWYSTYAVSLSPAMSNLIVLLNQKWVKVYKHDLLETIQPERIQMSNTGIQNMNTWIQYRVNRIPYTGDRNSTWYVVIPRLWIVTPIIDIPIVSDDFAKVNKGLSIDFNSYLQKWVVHFPSAWLGEIWNVVIAGHSSFWRKDIWRYKNIFFSLPLLDFGDQIWLYKKNWSGRYDRFIYMVQKSFETVPSDVSVMKQTYDKSLTLFTCVPIGTAKSRRVVKATYIDPPKKFIRKSKMSK